MKTVAEYVDSVPESLRAIAEQVTAIIDAGLPHATSRVYHGTRCGPTEGRSPATRPTRST